MKQTPVPDEEMAPRMARLATLIVKQRGLFFPLREDIMTDPADHNKPGVFLQLFPHPLSRLYLTLLWQVNREQAGDAVVVSNVWLRGFAHLHNDSLLQYREYLDVNGIIRAEKIGNGRKYLYRVAGSGGQPLSAETNMEAIARLGNPDRISEAAIATMIKRYGRRPVVAPPITVEEPSPAPSGDH
jgi:hypothetical protein